MFLSLTALGSELEKHTARAFRLAWLVRGSPCEAVAALRWTASPGDSLTCKALTVRMSRADPRAGIHSCSRMPRLQLALSVTGCDLSGPAGC
jgi:hypothetical protein